MSIQVYEGDGIKPSKPPKPAKLPAREKVVVLARGNIGANWMYCYNEATSSNGWNWGPMPQTIVKLSIVQARDLCRRIDLWAKNSKVSGDTEHKIVRLSELYGAQTF